MLVVQSYTHKINGILKKVKSLQLKTFTIVSTKQSFAENLVLRK